nr:hypothetical protein [Klebsiella pneumoniae]
MTDITELAQREKFEAWWEREYKHLESSKYTDAVPHIKYGFWMAYQAGGAELVEALEEAQSANEYLREQSAEWERKAISNFEECAEMSARIDELESQRKLAFSASNRWADKFREAEQRIAEPDAQSDYFASLVAMARVSADKAIRKFPQPNYVLLKVAEEAGEVVQAGVHYAENRMEWGQVEGEIVQLLAMLIRLVTEGDQVNGITLPALCSAGIKVEAE